MASLPDVPMPRERLAARIVHPLPAAPSFVGREAEMEELRLFWRNGRGVLSLVGLGGAGKTAIIERFVRELVDADDFDGLFVWSFYDDPDTNAFMKSAVEYLAGDKQMSVSGAGWFFLLREALSQDRRVLVVLDGLERVQRTQTDSGGLYGELEDPLLRGLVTRLAVGGASSKAIITSRFPVSDLESYAGRGYQVVDIDLLGNEAAKHVLRLHGSKSSDQVLDQLLSTVGRHALTVDLLGAAIANFFAGNAEELLQRNALSGDLPLKEVLSIFQEKLPRQSLDLLSRLCVFRFGVHVQSLAKIFLEVQDSEVAGSLADLKEDGWRELLTDLERMHLIYREVDDRVTVHPAVRDHFYSVFRDSTAVHGAVSKHLLSLSGRPGVGLPTAKEALDLLEELVYHAIRAGRNEEAAEIYFYRMGGNDHLNVSLGEYARTFRILNAFPQCPDPGGMYYCWRAMGRFDEALKWRPQNSYIGIILGSVTEHRSSNSAMAKKIAEFLQGADQTVISRSPDSPIPAAFLHLLRDDPWEAERTAKLEIEESLFKDDIVRNQLVMAEVLRRKQQSEEAKRVLDDAATWVLASGSQEHLCLLHLIRARFALEQKNPDQAVAALEEALQTSEECGFELFRIMALVEMAACELARGEIDQAQSHAESAKMASAALHVKFVWGELSADRLLSEAHLAKAELSEGLEALRRVYAAERQFGLKSQLATGQHISRLQKQLESSA